ncbi:MAG TPA: energy transducer TonB [Pyrinomonadaceae bacterium]
MKYLRCFLALSFVAAILLAQPAQSQNASKRAKGLSSSFDRKPFNKNVEDLPPNYLGNSYAEILVALMKQGPIEGKGEFESTIDYKARMERLKSKPLAGPITRNSLLAFIIRPDGEQMSVKYDADLTALDAVLKWRRYETSGATYTLKSSENSKYVASYIGRNAFNVKRRIQVYRNDDFYIGTNTIKPLRSDETGRVYSIKSFTEEPTFNTSIILPPSEARIAKGNLRALIICRLADQPLYQNKDHDTPEITDPYDRYNFTHVLIVVPEEIWFYDLPSGRVYEKISYDSSKQGSSITKPDADVTNLLLDESRIYNPKEVTQPARIISRPDPQYTEKARENQVSGTVVLRAVLSASGQVTNIRTVSGLPDGLTERAIAAARQIKFAPATKDGRAVSQYIQIEYNFNLY